MWDITNLGFTQFMLQAYMRLPGEEDFNFEERFQKLKAKFLEQLKEEERLNKLILENLGKIEINSEG